MNKTHRDAGLKSTQPRAQNAQNDIRRLVEVRRSHESYESIEKSLVLTWSTMQLPLTLGSEIVARGLAFVLGKRRKTNKQTTNPLLLRGTPPPPTGSP